MIEKEDILKDIPDEDLPKLAEIYENHKDWAPHVYSTIQAGIEWKKNNINCISFMSPNNCWKEDEESGRNVYEALTKTKRLETDYSDRRRLFFSIDDKLYPVVVKVMKEKEIEFIEIPYHMYTIPRHEALKFDIECPSEVYIKKLDKADAATVNEVWPYNYKNSEKYISLLIEANAGYGIFLKHNNELVAWLVLSMLGQLGFLQTKEDYKKKGYATLVVKYASKELAKKGHNAFGTVLVQNIAAVKMFEKMGFRNIGSCTYALFT